MRRGIPRAPSFRAPMRRVSAYQEMGVGEDAPPPPIRSARDDRVVWVSLPISCLLRGEQNQTNSTRDKKKTFNAMMGVSPKDQRINQICIYMYLRYSYVARPRKGARGNSGVGRCVCVCGEHTPRIAKQCLPKRKAMFPEGTGGGTQVTMLFGRLRGV